MKAILIVLDGMADRPVAELGGKTPLEAASTPALDFMAKNGACGTLDVLGGIAPESDSAVLSILGYDPYRYYTGRGPLEAVGIGIRMKPGMLALRCNFATTSNGTELLDRRAGRTLTSKEAAEIAYTINRKVKLKGAKFVFKASVAHRAVLLIKAPSPLSAKITNTDPAYAVGKGGVPEALAKFEKRVIDSEPLEETGPAGLSARLLNEFTSQCYNALRNHPVNKKRAAKGLLPANTIISRDAGDKLPELYDISKRYGKKFAILADMPLEEGIGRLSRMAIVKLPLPTFGKEDHKIRVLKTIASLKKYDCIYIHIKGPDLFGHDGDFMGKKNCIEEIDKYLFAPLLKKIDLKKTIIAVTADHATPCSMKGHSGDAVPFLVSGGKTDADGISQFSERKSASGRLGNIKATELMPLIMGYLKK
ncbi:2,3-bisphosphoglycerate-independent phosphoglycerate mutase [Candidatus Woesearchaeota archaeon]|nr:2,3-bisphosphoglycerate-independent phosphoglycerate mutase [Candidatus Woesearchaeota archaeon]